MHFLKLKALMVILAALLVAGVTGCGDNDDIDGDAAGAGEAAAAEEENNIEPEEAEVDEDEILKYHATAYFNMLESGNYMMSAEDVSGEFEDVFMLDIRASDDYNESHIPGAVNIPMGNVGLEMGQLPEDEKIIITCYSGQTASQTAGVLRMAGYNTYILTGGMRAWDEAEYPVE